MDEEDICEPRSHFKAVYTCAICEDDIREDEEYIEYDGEYYHAHCMAHLDAYELAELLGTSVQFAEYGDDREPEIEAK